MVHVPKSLFSSLVSSSSICVGSSEPRGGGCHGWFTLRNRPMRNVVPTLSDALRHRLKYDLRFPQSLPHLVRHLDQRRCHSNPVRPHFALLWPTKLEIGRLREHPNTQLGSRPKYRGKASSSVFIFILQISPRCKIPRKGSDIFTDSTIALSKVLGILRRRRSKIGGQDSPSRHRLVEIYTRISWALRIRVLWARGKTYLALQIHRV